MAQSCEDLNSRISKSDLFACLALWMEQSPLAKMYNLPKSDASPSSSNATDQQRANNASTTLEETAAYNKVGVVIVDSTESILSVECTRNFLHGVANALMDSHGRLESTSVYVSRKPCCLCTKLMVTAGVARVFYLPFEPECPDKIDMACVDKLFQTCPIAQCIYVPSIEEKTPGKSSLTSPYATSKPSHEGFTREMLGRYWSESWREQMPSVLPEYDGLKDQIDGKIVDMIKWISEVTFGDVPNDVTFHADDCPENHDRESRHLPTDTEPGDPMKRNSTSEKDEFPTNPEPGNEDWQELARHFSRMAHILSQRSDDPKRGVGAVITKQNQIVAVGWNGYPPKAQLADFPRASHIDTTSIKEMKYPFSVHAEQSAILRRNTREIGHCSTTIFVSKKPCDECVPLLLKAGVQNAVYPFPAAPIKKPYLTYHLIRTCIREGKLRGFKSVLRSNGRINAPENPSTGKVSTE